MLLLFSWVFGFGGEGGSHVLGDHEFVDGDGCVNVTVKLLSLWGVGGGGGI